MNINAGRTQGNVLCPSYPWAPLKLPSVQQSDVEPLCGPAVCPNLDSRVPRRVRFSLDPSCINSKPSGSYMYMYGIGTFQSRLKLKDTLRLYICPLDLEILWELELYIEIKKKELGLFLFTTANFFASRNPAGNSLPFVARITECKQTEICIQCGEDVRHKWWRGGEC
jgi:hypothetical protein